VVLEPHGPGERGRRADPITGARSLSDRFPTPAAEFRLLGPLQVLSHGRPVSIQGGKQRTLLAVLLLDANRTVPIRELADKLWNDDTPADPRSTAHTRSPTRQLPMPTAGIVGRRAPIDDIVQTLGSEPAQRRQPLVLVIGPPGVGKTTVAIAAAHRLAPHYPDGQLFAELAEHPFITGSTLGVLQYFLRTLGTPPHALPTRLDDAVATFRSMTADRRLLAVLDGVTDGNAIRTLLPGAVTCGVLITGRQSSRLASLLVSPGRRHVALDVLPAQDGLDLLAAVAGEQRVRGEREAARRLVDACGGSPLALRTVAARLATDPGLTIATCVSESARATPRPRTPTRRRNHSGPEPDPPPESGTCSRHPAVPPTGRMWQLALRAPRPEEVPQHVNEDLERAHLPPSDLAHLLINSFRSGRN
jgi:hypothetical protein